MKSTYWKSDNILEPFNKINFLCCTLQICRSSWP